MKIIVLSDNRTADPNLQTEHGLSIYVETEKHKILLDTGGSALFIENAKKLNVDIAAVDIVFISHGHSDHIGGLPAFLGMNKQAKIYMSAFIPSQMYYSNRNGLHSISTEFDFTPYADRIVYIEDDLQIADEIHIYRNQSQKYALPLGNRTLFQTNEKEELIPDDFKHELILTVGEKKLFVFTGCAHQGVLNMLETITQKSGASIKWVMGGFHLLDAKNDVFYETEEQIQIIAKDIKESYPDTHFYTGHCTGEKAFQFLHQSLGEQIRQFYCGFQTEF